MPRLIDLTGLRFSRLYVVSRAANAGKHPTWLCRCDCGNEKIALSTNIVSGKVQSCGCLHKERASAATLTHGRQPKRLYDIWCSMRQRCRDPKCRSYSRYGGRGISICAEWKEFEAFRDWSFANGYEESLSIDRIDNDGNYEPANCRWATMVMQARNSSNARAVIRSDGRVFLSIAEAAEASNCNQTKISAVCRGVRKRTGGFSWVYYGIERQEAA